MAQLLQTWDNTHFFQGTDDPRIATEIDAVKSEIASLVTGCEPFGDRIATAEILAPEQFAALIAEIKAIHLQRNSIVERLSNVHTFISSTLSVNAKDPDANIWLPTLQQIWATLTQAMTPVDVFLVRVSDAFVTALLADPALEELSFSVIHSRRLKDQLLSVDEEKIITGLAVTGLHGWGNLYDKLAGSLQCTINGESVGLAKAANLLGSDQRTTREAAWRGINQAWSGSQETVAMILNAINGWRLEETQQRGRIRTLHYLDKSCHQSRIERSTLDALMDSTYRHRAVGQRAMQAMAKALDLPKLAPWDVMAPPPVVGEAAAISFEAAIDLIAQAFSRLTPAMGDFAVMMAQKGWIDATPTPHRTTGAYCTKFANPREPRIFLTYEGTMGNVMTLAHELGHAWHNWVMIDLPVMKTRYSMTLAETASIFAETLVREALMQQAQDPAQQLEIAWQNAESAVSLLLNIPARFEFETRLVEARKTGFVIADQLSAMMHDSWAYWFEESLSEYDEMFWASKLHFSISQLGFYNYPYLFGYLFSLGIYAQRSKYGNQFNEVYTNLLRDTGSMTAEAVVQKHLGQDIRQSTFWEDSLKIVEQSIAQFEALVEQRQRSLTLV
ncbi:MAG: M3 family oligoendopeptidase [Synechococcales cyanobacterium CRU_2_2]|nr:M3 family oligoendopeptidase [Synechococcales cyanobacterium CRU_2_2]